MQEIVEKKPVIGNKLEAKKEESPEEIKRQIAFFTHVQTCSASRNARLKDLMQRNSTKKWDADKKQKMVRRLTQTTRDLQQCESALDQLRHRLEQITTA